MRLRVALLAAFLAVAGLAGCENHRDATALSKIHRIVLLVPENYEVFIQPNPPTALGIFGAVGAAVGAAVATPESTADTVMQELRASLRSQNLAYGSELADVVERTLEADGFTVVRRQVSHPNNEFLTGYSSFANDGDAVMDLIYTAGFRESRRMRAKPNRPAREPRISHSFVSSSRS